MLTGTQKYDLGVKLILMISNFLIYSRFREKISENGKNDAQILQVCNFWTGSDEDKPMFCWLPAFFSTVKSHLNNRLKMPFIAKLDFVQVCRLSLNVYNNTLRKFYKFSDSCQSWTSPTLQSADWPISRQYYRPQMR